MMTILFAAVTVASAQETMEASGSVELSTDAAAAEADASGPGPLVLGLEVGGIFPQPFTELGTHVAFGVEVGYRLPPWGRKLEIFAAAGFAPPARDFSDGPYDAELDVQELQFSLGPRCRFLPVAKKLNVSLALGGRLFLVRSFSNGSAGGAQFAEYREQSTEPGFFGAVGGEYRLGPGAILLDLDLGWSALPHEITGDVSTGNLTATLGYRFFL